MKEPMEDPKVISSSEEFLWSLSDSFGQRFVNFLLRETLYSKDLFLTRAREWLAEFTQTMSVNPEEFDSRYVYPAFFLSALIDLVNWGAEMRIEEARIYVRKIHSNINDSSDSSRLRAALTALKTQGADYLPPVDEFVALEVLKRGEVFLEKVDSRDVITSNIFRSGVSTWSMPYRGREGRSTRFILWGSIQELKVPIGIIEVGDDAPHSPLRDRALGFNLPERGSDLSIDLILKLESLRKAIRPEGLPVDPTLPLAELYSRWLALGLDQKSGRDTLQIPTVKKRLAYLDRIVKAERSLSSAELWDEKIVMAGIRAIKDVTLNRVHMEIVICGALPPFGKLLGGKLVTMMSNHPLVRGTLDRPIGVLLEESFSREKLEAWLPRFGPLVTTTKGLFPNHSAQYNRVEVICGSKKEKLRKLGVTQGATMSHISDLTMKFAVVINESLGSDGVSREYGSGGAKRQRIITRASSIVGIPSESLYADVTRPVYGISFVQNSQEVVLGGLAPRWKDDGMLPMTPEEYEKASMDLWREKWLKTATSRGSRSL